MLQIILLLMKKLICILLMSWLPIFMVTANAMSLQMTSQNMSHSAEQSAVAYSDAKACHDKTNKRQDGAHHCVSCGFCLMATSMANFDTFPVIDILVFSSIAPEAIDVVFNATSYSPAFRPPIFN